MRKRDINNLIKKLKKELTPTQLLEFGHDLFDAIPQDKDTSGQYIIYTCMTDADDGIHYRYMTTEDFENA